MNAEHARNLARALVPVAPVTSPSHVREAQNALYLVVVAHLREPLENPLPEQMVPWFNRRLEELAEQADAHAALGVAA